MNHRTAGRRAAVRRKVRRRAGTRRVRNRRLLRARLGRYFDHGYDRGFDDGFTKALAEQHDPIFRRGYGQGYEKGYETGLYDGGDRYVDGCLPPFTILADVSVRQVVEAGVAALGAHLHPLLTPDQVHAQLAAALANRTPMSLVRLGDGELLTLAQDTVLSADEVRRRGPFLPYAGVNVPDYAARDRLIESVRRATIVGIPRYRLRNFQPLAFDVFRAFGFDFRAKPLTDSQMNFMLNQAGLLRPLLEGRRILLVGNRAPELAPVLQHRGLTVGGVVAPVHGVADAERVMGEIRLHAFDIALISSGVSAVILAERTANELGKVAVDFGHLADAMVKGEQMLI
jgi:hypothetical protein